MSPISLTSPTSHLFHVICVWERNSGHYVPAYDVLPLDTDLCVFSTKQEATRIAASLFAGYDTKIKTLDTPPHHLCRVN